MNPNKIFVISNGDVSPSIKNVNTPATTPNNNVFKLINHSTSRLYFNDLMW